MNGCFTLVKDKIFHPSISQFLTWLAEQNHQNNPLNLLDIDIRCFQRHQAIDENFALRRGENADLFEVGNKAAACRIEPVIFDKIIDARAAWRL